ncbi:hypothetical protein NXC12_PE00293 (plasmid) [Rhizobium etli]|uniref:Uncharacterized protein n=1 Tax=Rhizobium etli TaxID=29449 RepID=A0AAN1ENB7_RHIET|nr:hypothetical protein [Rhizobium etli]AGS26421.1 hypothetical protein REMIM1_PF00757 [Rhizobium etli bv. mimosae str. Mim1]ARQ13889.1 hypothetical protein NXC12_PE00293 [Rhizobium etli]
MASPWKLLARLVSPRHQQRQEGGSTGDMKPDLLAIANPTETAADNGLTTGEPPADEKPVAEDQLEAVLAAPDHSQTESSAHGTAGSEDTKHVEAAGPAVSDDAASVAREPRKTSQVGEGATRKPIRRGKTAARSEVVLPPSPGVRAVSDDAIRLDEEITLLREQLARKLRLQNAQLKRMLERFER